MLAVWEQPFISNVLAESGSEESSEILQNGTKWNQKGTKSERTISKYFKKTGLGKVSALQCFGAIVAPLVRCCVLFLRPLDFVGPICLLFLDVFVAIAKTRKIISFQQLYR